ncbi:MAG TPA: SLBB domain-containing protein, partial [Abditibacterium sp.]
MKKSAFMAALTLGAMPLLHSTANAAPQPAAPPFVAKAPVEFRIAGEVVKPGKYELNSDKPTLLDLIAASGGLTRNPARVHVKVRRGARIFDINIADLLKFKVNFALQDGDVVTVTSPHVLIMGAVKNPGSYPLPENGSLSIAEALMLAGGPIEAQGNEVVRLPAASLGKAGMKFLPIPASDFNQLLQ